MEALFIISLILSGIGAMEGAAAQRRQARYQAKVMERNALAAEEDARYAREAAAKKTDEHRKMVARLASTQRAKMASTGFVMGEGTFGDILEDTAVMGEMDALAIQHEGQIAGWQARERAKGYQAQAGLYSISGPSMGTTFLTSLGSAGMDYARFKS